MDKQPDLLAALLAHGLGYIQAAQLAEVCAACGATSELAVLDWMQEKGWIQVAEKRDLERLVNERIQDAGGDPSLAIESLGDNPRDDQLDLLQRTSASEIHSSGSEADEKTSGFESIDLDEATSHFESKKGATRDSEARPPDARRIQTITADISLQTRSRYALTRVHGEGGLGRIWLARDDQLNRDIALKEIKPEKEVSDEALKRFIREAQVTGQLEHPNIIPVYELARDQEDQRPYYTMRFLRGESFAEAITHFPMLDDYNTGPRDYLDHLEQAKSAVSIPLIASLNGADYESQ